MSGKSTDGLPRFGGPIIFLLPGSVDAYLDLANRYLFVRAKVTKGNGTNLNSVGPVNNVLHSLFNQVNIYLNDTLVTPSTNTYTYRAYTETALSYGTEAKEAQVTSQLWYKDTAGHMEAPNGTNEGLWDRKAYVADCRVVEMMGRLQSAHYRCHHVREKSRPESGRSDSANQGTRQGYGQVPVGPVDCKSVLRPAGNHVAHARKTYVAVLYRRHV